MDDRVIFEMLADLLRYPGEDWLPHLADCARVLAPVDPEAARSLEDLVTSLEGRTVEQMQELFIQTFDLSPVCSLEMMEDPLEHKASAGFGFVSGPQRGM